MASLDMSLDDMIKNRRNNERGRGQGRARRGGRGPGGPFRGGRSSGAPHRFPLGVNARPSAFTIAKFMASLQRKPPSLNFITGALTFCIGPVVVQSVRRTKNLPWQNGLLEDSLKAAGLSALDSGTKLYVTNMDVGVTNEDIRELFAEIGELIRYAIHYDKTGRPSGSAEVVFARRSDAFQACKKYNGVQLDGKPMKIEVVGSNAEVPVPSRVNVVGGPNGRRRTVVMAQGPARNRGEGPPAFGRSTGQRSRGGFRGGRGRGAGGRGRGRGGGAGGRWGKKAVEKSADDLDKELENYHAEAMQS